MYFEIYDIDTKECEIVRRNELLILTFTSGKLWLKMRRVNVISPVLHIFVSSLRLKHRMSMIQRALDSPVLVDYFSYPHHG